MVLRLINIWLYIYICMTYRQTLTIEGDFEVKLPTYAKMQQGPSDESAESTAGRRWEEKKIREEKIKTRKTPGE